MTDLRKAAEMALETLEIARLFITSKEKIKHPEGTEWYDNRVDQLRQALAQPEQECTCSAKDMPFGKCCKAQLEQEPVAWMHPDWRTYTRAPTPSLAPQDGWIPLYTAPPKKEWVGLTDDDVQETGRYSYCRGGTSEKLYHIMWNSKPSASVGWCRDELIAFARAIEAKLKEKNT